MITEGTRAAIGILREYKQLELRREELGERIARLIEGGTRTTASFTAVNPGSVHSKVEKAAVEIADLTAQIDAEIAMLTSKCWLIQNAINHMQNERYKRMLELRYIDGLKWSDVNKKLYISRQHSSRMHAKALMEFLAVYYKIESQ